MLIECKCCHPCLRNISMPKPFSFICSWPLSVFHIIEGCNSTEKLFCTKHCEWLHPAKPFCIVNYIHECFLIIWFSMMSRKFEGILFPSGEFFRCVYSAEANVSVSVCI